MQKIEFYNREREFEEFMRILNTRPDLITFIYGPINSGKTELVNYIIEKLDENYVVFYINLRERMIGDFNDFVEALFEIDVSSRRKVVVRELIIEMTKFAGIPISRPLLNQFFKEGRPKNAFRYIVEVMKEVGAKGKMPVLIMDELQKIGDIKIDGQLVYELFNLFIRLTKELHCCHVFAITSDSLFIEEVYGEAMLHGRCRYMLVDDFDHEKTVGFLRKYGFSSEEIRLVWEYFGGKPVYLVEAIKNKHRLKDFCEEMLNLRRRQIKDFIYRLEEESEKEYEKVLRLLETFKKLDCFEYEKLTKEMRVCVENNILFVDPVKGVVRPQSKLDLLAIRSLR